MLDENALHARTLLEQLNNPQPPPDYTAQGVSPTPPLAGPQSFAAELLAPKGPVPEAAQAAPLQGPPAPQPQPFQLPNGIITDPAQLAVEQAKTQNKAKAYNYQDASAAKRDVNDAANIEMQMAKASEPATQLLAQRSEASVARLQANQAAIEKQMNESTMHYQSVQAEMQKMATEAPQDLLGSAGVNRIGGYISIFLGGLAAGSNGGRNNNLEQIQQMADRNIAAQKNRYEMLSKVGMGEQTMFGMLQAKLQNSTAAETTMQNAYLESYKSQLLASAAQFRNPAILQKAKAQADQIDAQMHQNNLKVEEDYQAQASGQMALAQQSHILAMKDAHAEHKDFIDEQKLKLDALKFDTDQNEKTSAGEIAGFTGKFPVNEHPRIAKIVGGARNIVSSLDDIRRYIDSGPTIGNIRDFKSAQAQAFVAARNFFETGTRLEEGEAKQIAQVALQDMDALIAMFQHVTSQTDLLAIKRKIENTQALVTKNAFITAQAASPQIKFDDSDPLTGRFNPAKYIDASSKEAAKTKGQQELSGLPDYNADEYGAQ